MTKSERPPFRMMVRGNHLVPASQYDEERFDEIAQGTEFDCLLTEIRNDTRLRLERRYWAVLGKLIKVANTPWKRATDASEFLKFSLGVVGFAGQPGRAQPLQYTKSLRDLNDQEFSEFYDLAMGVLERVTGIDPNTIRREAPDTGERDQEPLDDLPSSGSTGAGGDPSTPLEAVATAQIDEPSVEDYPPATDAGGSDVTQPPTHVAAADQLEEPSSAVSGDAGGGVEEPTLGVAAEPDEREMVGQAKPMAVSALQDEAIRKVMFITTDPDLHSVEERLAVLKELRPIWQEHLPGFPGFVKVVFDTAGKIVRGELKPETAKRYMDSVKV